MSFPYTYIKCPCTSTAQESYQPSRHRRVSQQHDNIGDVDVDEDKALDPSSPRANYSLFPYENLLFCDDCHQIRCPRCWTDEIANCYCPSCLFEVPAGLVKSDGNRCTRNCYNCPLCTSPLAVQALDQDKNDSSHPEHDSSQPTGPFFLSCSYCHWSSVEIGVTLAKPTRVTEQLVELERQRHVRSDVVDGVERHSDTSDHAVFSNLINFYEEQILQESGASYTGANNDSPGLARVMQLYGGLSPAVLKAARQKPRPMRQALSVAEGLMNIDPSCDDQVIERLSASVITETTTTEQRASHVWNSNVRFTRDLWPVPTLLKTRKSKRCAACRHILLKMDDRHGTTKYKIRLLAQNFIPKLTLRIFPSKGKADSTDASFALTPAAYQIASQSTSYNLTPSYQVQYLLTMSNPLFEPVKVTLATPAMTSGRYASKVTILCPTFEIGADGDMWDEALALSQTGSTSSSGLPRSNTVTSLTDDKERQPEAGKIWEKGKNWVRVVVEVVPGSAKSKSSLSVPSHTAPAIQSDAEFQKYRDTSSDVLEIPIHVRMEWESETMAGEATGAASVVGAKPAKESRELAFWTVVGAGRIIE